MDARFDAQDWRTMELAPLWVFQMVAAADKSIDDEESSKLVDEMFGTVETENALARDVLKSVSGDFQKVMQRYYSDERKPADGLAEVAALVKSKAAEDVGGFAEGMMSLGRKLAASADKEGTEDDASEALALTKIHDILTG